MEKKVVLVVKLVVKDGKEAEFHQIIKILCTEARKEPGCLRYDMVLNDQVPNEYWLIEEYVDDAAFSAHRKTEHSKKYGPQIQQFTNATLIKARQRL